MENYNLIKKIGSGSYSNIYLAKSKLDNNYYAFKKINLENLNDKESKMIITEILVGYYNNCPYIIKYHDILYHKNNIYLKMKYCNQGNLQQYLSKKRLLNSQKHDLMINILLAIQYLHYNKVIHRDIKIQNILVYDDKPYIADFGTCCILPEYEYFGKTAIGTPYYISPEIIEGKYHTYKTDIYSLGCLFCEIYKKKLPYSGKNLCNLYYNVLNSKNNITFTNSKIDIIIQKMINKNCINRPSIQDIIEYFNNHFISKKKQIIKKDKEFSDKIRKEIIIPKNWTNFINNLLYNKIGLNIS